MSRPDTLHGETQKLHTEAGNLYLTINYLDDKPYEMFIRIAKHGTVFNNLSEAIARLSSLALKRGATLAEISKQLRGIGGKKLHEGDRTIPDAIGETLIRRR